jgi:hypothetical protein
MEDIINGENKVEPIPTTTETKYFRDKPNLIRVSNSLLVT